MPDIIENQEFYPQLEFVQLSGINRHNILPMTRSHPAIELEEADMIEN
jgi:hypothetical protein